MIYISNLVSRRCRTSSRFAAALISSSVLLFGASLALSGCASSKEEQRYSWPLATASPEDTVTQLFAEKFAEEVHDLSNGAMRIQVYANSTLGGDRDLLETCADGDIPFVVQNTAPQVSFMKDLAVLTFHASLIRWMTAAKSWMIRIFTISSARCTPTAVTTCSAWQIKDSAS